MNAIEVGEGNHFSRIHQFTIAVCEIYSYDAQVSEMSRLALHSSLTCLILCLSGPLLGPYDFTFLLILQLSCILHMVPFWELRTKLRVMQIVESDGKSKNPNSALLIIT